MLKNLKNKKGQRTKCHMKINRNTPNDAGNKYNEAKELEVVIKIAVTENYWF